MPYSPGGSNGIDRFQGLLNSLDSFKQDRQETRQARENKDSSYFQKERRDLETLKKFKDAEKSAAKKPASKPTARKAPPKKK